MIKNYCDFFCSDKGWAVGDRVETVAHARDVLWSRKDKERNPIGATGTLVEGHVPEALNYYTRNKKGCKFFLVEWDNGTPTWNAYALRCVKVEEDEWE